MYSENSPTNSCLSHLLFDLLLKPLTVRTVTSHLFKLQEFTIMSTLLIQSDGHCQVGTNFPLAGFLGPLYLNGDVWGQAIVCNYIYQAAGTEPNTTRMLKRRCQVCSAGKSEGKLTRANSRKLSFARRDISPWNWPHAILSFICTVPLLLCCQFL